MALVPTVVLGVLGQQTDEPRSLVPTPDVAWSALAPLLVLVGGALVLLLVEALLRRRPPAGTHAVLTVVIALGAVAAAVPLWVRVQDADRGPFSTVAGAVGIDGFSVFATFAICAGVVLTALLLDGFLRREDLDGVEPYVLVLLSASGGLMMASANDLIVLFLGLEVLSLAVYVLAAMHLRKATSQEAGVKYFVLGAFASAFFLYGIALVYGATGTTSLVEIADLFATTVLPDDGLLLAGLGLLIVGLAFKVAAVPFHFWTPDVYQGAPSATVAFMASGVKVAGFAGMLRVLFLAFSAYRVDWQPLIYGVAVATLVVGAVLAVVQTDVKRMLAYSSINHAGFVLVAVQAGSTQGVRAALFYLGAYTFMVAGSFGVVTVVGRRGDVGQSLEDYRGLSKARPGLALVFALLLFAQAGVPLTSGFFAKFYVVTAAVDAGSAPLAVVAMLTAVVSAFLYLRIVVAMYMDDAPEEAGSRRIAIPVGARVALGIALVVTIGVGLWPGAIAGLAEDATPALVVDPSG
ncbi:MAG: NADH-quinone oxidoreductase subunit N [Acidimicrobiia bacterium]